MTRSTAVCLALLLAGCAATPAPRDRTTPSATTSTAPRIARAQAERGEVVLASASASLVSGKLALVPMGDGVHLSGEIGGLTPNGTHALHIHEKGDCSAADASSAGGHFNPNAAPHGRAGQGAHHAGDMDNIVADARGVARVNAHARGVTLGDGGIADVAGRAVIVHAQADDYRTQPTGNAGARLACGVIRALR
ncbi:MAG TPA: superoxide dismutase family protein [Lysobacter sp.]|nr:superoxide dismutase family protein [Lysobacter sp.]